MITDIPTKFSSWFNTRYAGIYRQITPEDLKDILDCGLICRYGYYSRSIDGEFIRRLLQYENLRDRRLANQVKDKKPLSCKSCGQPLLTQPEGKIGRHKEYCSQCDCHRNRDRQKRLRSKRRKLSNRN
jgi:hypothetical protein